MYHLSVKVVSTLRTRNATLANLKNAVNYVSPPTPVHLTGVEVNLASPGGNSFWEGRFTPSPPIQSCGANVDVVDRPTQLICIADIYLYLSTDKYKRQSRAICQCLCALQSHVPPVSSKSSLTSLTQPFWLKITVIFYMR